MVYWALINVKLKFKEMKKVFMTAIAIMFIAVFSIAQESPMVFETMYLMPKEGKSKALYEAIQEHNKKFHLENPHKASLHYISVGEKYGQFGWVMGPMKFADMDNRPSGDHDKDWAETVTPLVKKTSTLEYWINSEKLSYWPEEGKQRKMAHLRYWNVKDGKEEVFYELIGKVVKVFSENKYEHSWGVYTSAFDTGNGRDVVAVMDFDNWAFFDEQGPFVKDYEIMFGEDSFKEFMKEFMMVTHSMTDEVRMMNMDDE